MRILLTHTPAARSLQFPDDALARLRRQGEVFLHSGDQVLAGDALVAAARGCNLVIADRQTAVPADVLANMDDVLAVMRCAVDIRTIDVGAAGARGILVTRSIPSFATSVAELALGMILDGARGISDAVAAYRTGRQPTLRLGRELAGDLLGIVGFGVIGRRLCAMAQGIGMRVAICDPDPGPVPPGVERMSMDELLGLAGVVVCLAPVTADTHGMFGTHAFAAMRDDAMFLNLARGELVDEAALIAALDDGQIALAALDVGMAPDQKPSPSLSGRADVLATPHIGGQTPQAIGGQALHVALQVEHIAEGRFPPDAVNPAEAQRLRDHFSKRNRNG